jgi:hypothetical protein
MLGPFPALLALDRLAGLKQGAGLQAGFQQDHLIEVRRLLHATQWCCFLDGRRSQQIGLGQ